MMLLASQYLKWFLDVTIYVNSLPENVTPDILNGPRTIKSFNPPAKLIYMLLPQASTEDHNDIPRCRHHMSVQRVQQCTAVYSTVQRGDLSIVVRLGAVRCHKRWGGADYDSASARCQHQQQHQHQHQYCHFFSFHSCKNFHF